MGKKADERWLHGLPKWNRPGTKSYSIDPTTGRVLDIDFSTGHKLLGRRDAGQKNK